MPLVGKSLSKEYGDQVVLASVEIGINEGHRIALVGENGAGKSTLLAILANELVPDEGAVAVPDGWTIGYLRQNTPREADISIRALFKRSVSGLEAIERQIDHLSEQMGIAHGDELDRVMQRFGELQHRFEVRGGYELEYRSSEILAGLGLSGLDQDRPVTSLSGGELSRVALAALLLEAPDVLLLDEPTNHLDVSGLNWLQTYLASYRGGILFVSHDRVLIDAVATSIVELDDSLHALERYEGNYQRYLEAKTAKRARQQQAYETWQAEIAELEEQARTVARSIGHGRAASDNDKRSYNNRGIGVDKAISRNVRAAQERLDRLKRNPVEPPTEPMRFHAVLDRSSKVNDSDALAVSDLSKAFGDRHLFAGLDFALKDGDRLAIVGPNGAGKSTLVEILLGKLEPDTGSVYIGKGRRVGVLEQHPRRFPAELNLGQAFIWALHQAGLTDTSNEARGWLVRWGLFRRGDLPKPVNSLSTGQVRKLEIALIFASDPDILILDEPTNHVSLPVLESFETALAEFTGPVVAVSHDRRFLKRFDGEAISLGIGATV